MPARPRVLIALEQLPVARRLSVALEDRADAVIARSGVDALELLKSGAYFDLVLSDVALQGMNGSVLFAQARAFDPSLARRFVFVSTGIDPDEEARIRATGARRLSKPVSLAGIRALLGVLGE
jgi:CheY-like chemotaxis protein